MPDKIRELTLQSGDVRYVVEWRKDGRRGRQSIPCKDKRTAQRAWRIVAAAENKISKEEVAAKLLGYRLVARTQEMTLHEWWPGYLTGKAGAVQGDTIRGYQAAYNNHIRNELGDIALGDLRRSTVTEWTRHLAGLGLKAATIARHHAILHGALDAAVLEGLIGANPAAKTGLPKGELEDDDEHVYLERWEAALLVEAITAVGSPRDVALVLVALGCGGRWGELTALRACDCRLLTKPATVTFSRAWKRPKTDGGDWWIGRPKSARSRRTVPIPPRVAASLLSRQQAGGSKKSRAERLLFAAAAKVADDQVRLDHSNWSRSVWAPAVRLAVARGLPEAKTGVTFHDLRHTYASWLIAEGRQLVEVSRRLGHSSVAVTEQVYVHLVQAADEGTADAIGRALDW